MLLTRLTTRKNSHKTFYLWVMWPSNWTYLYCFYMRRVCNLPWAFLFLEVTVSALIEPCTSCSRTVLVSFCAAYEQINWLTDWLIEGTRYAILMITEFVPRRRRQPKCDQAQRRDQRRTVSDRDCRANIEALHCIYITPHVLHSFITKPISVTSQTPYKMTFYCKTVIAPRF